MKQAHSLVSGWLLAAAFACGLLAGGCERPPDPDARFVCTAEIKGFDPAFANDQYSAGAQIQVFEGLYEFQYLKRPMELQPLLADGQPTISADGLTYTFRLIDARYQDDPCFAGGKGRAVTAQDFVWCWKRLVALPDSTGSWIFEGKIAGLDDWAKRAKAVLGPIHDNVNDTYPYTDPAMDGVVAEEVAGLRALDDRTLQVTLTEPYPQFMWTLAMSFTVVYPPEAIAKYGMDFMNHPVGCGPYRTEDYWIFDRKITYVRNLNWHGGTYPTEGAPGDIEAGLLEDAGKPLPFLDRIEFRVVPESQPRWLMFLEGDVERVETEREIWEKAMTPEGALRPDLAERGVRVLREPKSDIAYNAFNMEDPVLGAAAGDRGRKLRQALCLAQDQDRWIKVMRNGFWAVPAKGPVPPNVAGYIADEPSPYSGRDLVRAKALLAEAGYPGGRGLPVLNYEMSGSDAVTRAGAEIFKNNMADIGVKVDLVANTWDQFNDKVQKKKGQVFGMAWGADYPDAQNFLQLFYGPNVSPGPNGSNYSNPAYDALYDRMKVMQPGPARDEVIRKMLRIVNEDCPWSYTDHRIQYSYAHGTLHGFKFQDINPWLFKYYRVDRKRAAQPGAERSTDR